MRVLHVVQHLRSRKQTKESVTDFTLLSTINPSSLLSRFGEVFVVHSTIDMMRYTNQMTSEEEKLSEDAYSLIKARNGKDTIKSFLESGKYQPSNTPIALFMAGSPGAGKTEVSKSFIKQFKDAPIRIDADEIRITCTGYTGDNAHVFQRAATKGVHILQDHALHNSINYILDGTFAYASTEKNIERALRYNFLVKI